MNESILKKFFMIQRLQFKILHKELEKHGIHPGQPPMLMIVAKHEGVTQKRIAEELNVKPATVAIMLRRMERAGLIRREQDENDKRLQRVYLTEKGKLYCDFLKEHLKSVETVIVKGFTDAEKNQLESFLRRIIANLENRLRGEAND
ncbi:MarR family winged helix-turn-helix transcriptional regulator [Thermotoga caldifontis]|uniref:MarR family winged helix-turn-helix transcriptional regulator n=1 Tax=Thermotoga caldifontis TaxID=1508419 RepID=UPI0005972B0F|nr:MarR family transcriptional regulator [Thermotoga caldifontis]